MESLDAPEAKARSRLSTIGNSSDERFLLRHRSGSAFLPAAPLEILKIGGKAQMQIFLLGEILQERVRLGRSSFGGGGISLQFS